MENAHHNMRMESSTGKNKVLVVDPDDRSVARTTEILMSRGCDVYRAKKFQEAVQLLHSCEFECIVLDVDLCEMKDCAAIKMTRAIDPKIRIIVTSAQNDKELERRIRSEGIFYYFIKSFGEEELQIAVLNALRIHADREGGRQWKEKTFLS